ncbi:MAG TPA: pyruvate dehydrogenase complex dihydrolipoamide acetyltransferase [Gemmatimonadaceae bacterium]|nr:pyruvate dehydrogenase complex dihydrolipoamide acetyltransferase [Gemmatimonadaceae bacterium]
MPTKVYMEALSPTMEEGRLVKWLKNEGDQVASGDVLAEVETDKAVMELAARGEGVLRKRLLEEGGTAPVGQLVGVIAAPDENIDELISGAPAAGGADAAAPAAEDAGARTKDTAGASPNPKSAEQSQGEASTPPKEKAPARGAPTARGDGGDDRPEPEGADASGSDNGGRARSSPLARRMASERGVDLAQVQGSGPGGRIIRRDIEAAAAGGATRATRAPAPDRAARARDGDHTDVPLSQMRRTIARRLAESIGPIPTFYLTATLDLERVAEMRGAMAELGDEFKVSFNDIILKAVATALAQHPECNAHWLGDGIRQFHRVHIGMAVAIDEGLITPVIFDADQKGLRELSGEARDLAKRARDRKLKPDEYTGSTFSVSNLGMFGIDHFTAIINPPEAGILAIGAIEETPVVRDGEVTVRRRMRVTMSCDHRVIDGAMGAKFLQTLRRLIENPLAMIY